MTEPHWQRPTALQELVTSIRPRRSVSAPAWPEVVARCRAAGTLATLRGGLVDGALVIDAATDAADDAWPADFVEAFRRLGHDEDYGTETAAGLYGLFHHLNEDQLRV